MFRVLLQYLQNTYVMYRVVLERNVVLHFPRSKNKTAHALFQKFIQWQNKKFNINSTCRPCKSHFLFFNVVPME